MDDSNIEFTKHLVLKNLRIGDFFGGRCLFTKEDYKKKQELFPNYNFSDAEREKSKLSVVANSMDVVVYVLDKNK